MNKVKTERLPKNIAFEMIASRRAREVQEALRVLSNCSNKRNYEYTSGQVEQLFKVLQLSLDAAKLKFTDSSGQKSLFFKEDNN